MIKLHGDASNRSYYRGTKEDGSRFVLMKLPRGKSSVSEEITNLRGTTRELPFLNIARFLREHEIPVPRIYDYRKDDDEILLEDLGDTSLEKLLVSAADEERERWYRKAIELLLQIQQLERPKDDSCIAFHRSFDRTLYRWEFDHFMEYGLEIRTGVRLSMSEKELFREETEKIITRVTSLPLVFTHRDYQSRNLMVQGERLRLIDFQDALLAPPHYDLVALLRDSYLPLSQELVLRLIRFYLNRAKQSGHLHLPASEDEFFRTFDLLTIQRKLKDAGRFVYIDRVKKNSSFLRFVPTSLEYVREALKRNEALQPLFDFLKRHVSEL